MSRTVKAVLVSDIHYSLSTLQLADASMRMAIAAAAEHRVPLIDCGDLTNDKAVLRGEVVNQLISTFEMAAHRGVDVRLLVGNHSLLNEKGKEHALNFLEPYATIVDSPCHDYDLDLYFIPYQSTVEGVESALAEIPKGSTIIMHQGLQGAMMGHYAQDKTSLSKEVFSDFRVISGHYHCAQDIRTGRPRKGAVGLFSYVGNPYTLTYGEASDGPKGYALLMSDGTIDRVGTNLRKHVVIEHNFGQPAPIHDALPGDLVWLKIRGAESDITGIDKSTYTSFLKLPSINYRLDLIPTDKKETDKEALVKKGFTDYQLLDTLVGQMIETDEQKAHLKNLWRELLA